MAQKVQPSPEGYKHAGLFFSHFLGSLLGCQISNSSCHWGCFPPSDLKVACRESQTLPNHTPGTQGRKKRDVTWSPACPALLLSLPTAAISHHLEPLCHTRSRKSSINPPSVFPLRTCCVCSGRDAFSWKDKCCWLAVNTLSLPLSGGLSLPKGLQQEPPAWCPSVANWQMGHLLLQSQSTNSLCWH